MNKFFDSFLKAGAKVSHLPIPTWSKVAIAAVAGAAAYMATDTETAQGVADFVMNMNGG